MLAKTREEVAKLIRKNCKTNEWHFEEQLDDETGDIIFIQTFSLDCTIGSTRIVLRISENQIIVSAYIDASAGKHINEVGEYLHRVNFEALGIPRFELDYDDGEISIYYQTSFLTLENDDDLTLLWIRPVWGYEDYGDNLMKVILGVQTPKEAICEAIENVNKKNED